MMTTESRNRCLFYLLFAYLLTTGLMLSQMRVYAATQLDSTPHLMQWNDKWGEFAYSTSNDRVVTKYIDAQDPEQHFIFERITGNIYRIKSGSNHKYITYTGSGNWSYIQLAAADGSDYQKWRVMSVSGETYKIQSVSDSSQYLFSWGSYEGGEMGTHNWKGWGSQHIDLIPTAAPPAPDPVPLPQCDDGIKNQDESDVDCGGICAPCDEGLTCNQDSDCFSGHCDSGICASDGGESDHSPYVPKGYTLSFKDEFNTDLLDLAEDGKKNWATRFVGWNCMSLYGNSDDALKVHESYRGTDGRPMGTKVHEISNGTLKLYGKKLPTNRQPAFWDYPYTSGMISGELNFGQTHGYWETRVKLDPVSQGHHWAIWLLPQNGEWPPEVDMLEVVGLNPGQFSSCFHYNNAAGEHKGDIVFYDAPNGAGGWHTFGFLWTPKEMKWFVNGRLVKTQATTYMPAIPHYFLITLEIASNWPGDPDHTTVWPAKAEVDYVRIYKME